MIARKAETAVQGWSVDPMEDVILTHTHTHTRAREYTYTYTQTTHNGVRSQWPGNPNSLFLPMGVFKGDCDLAS